MTDRLALPRRYRDQLEALLREHVPDVEVWAYGSRVKGESREGSDLDLVLRGPALEPLDGGFYDLLEAIEKSNIPILVQAYDWAMLRESFHSEIERDYVVVQEGAKQRTVRGWTKVTLGEVAQVRSGFAFKSKDWADSGISVVKIANVKDGNLVMDGCAFVSTQVAAQANQFNLNEGDILTALTGYVGEVAMVRRRDLPAVLNQRVGMFSISDTSMLDGGYLFQLLRDPTVREHIDGLAYGSAQPNISPSLIHGVTIPLPPLPEQRAIAHVLGTLDDKIELNRRMNETLEAMARALFKSWFVDFDPVRAKMDGREPYLPPDLWALFPDRLVDSELGEIPKGWEVKTLGDCFSLTMGQSPPGNTYNGNGEGLTFFQGNADFGFRYPQKRKYSTAPTRTAGRDDTLVSVRAPVGAINMAWEQCCIGRGVAALRHGSGSTSFTCYSAWALQDEMQQYEHTGTVFGAITKSQFEALRVIEPLAKLVDRFETQVQSLDQRIRSSVADSRTLTGPTGYVAAEAGFGRVAGWGHMKLDERIRERLAALIKKGEDVLGTKRPPQSNVLGGRSSVDSERYAEWRNQTVVCLTQVFGSAHIYTASFESQADHRQYASHVTAGLGILPRGLGGRGARAPRNPPGHGSRRSFLRLPRTG